MNLIRSLMGRRQFLVAATVTSAAALARKKIARIVDPGLQTSVAMAAERSGAAAVKGGSNRYSHLLSPLKIRNVVLKNRMIHTVGAPPHFLQGPETFPSDVIRAFYANAARGAAIVACRITGATGLPRKEREGDHAHMAMFDTSDPAVMNYIDQLVEGVHAMGSLVIGGSLAGGKDIATQARRLEDQGIDVVSMGGGVTSIRDKNAMRSAIEQMQAVRNATNLLVSMSLSVQHPLLRPETSDSYTRNAPTLEEVIAAAKMFEGSVDILQIRPATAMGMHPTSWNQEEGKPMALSLVQAIKESGVKIYLSPNGGFQDLDFNEECIASGKCDMITMARPWIADPEYGKKAYEGRGEDVVPCLLCDKCHGLSMEGPWYTVCSVNPKLGLESAIKVIDAPTASRKVAVIGGGPAGMKAAITAAERGHKVTLYEKNGYLGGLLRHSDFSPFKWTLKRYKNYLVRQMDKAGVEVHLSTEATPDMIKAKGYDTVMVAVGAEPVIPKISGSDGKNVYNIIDAYSNEKELGKNVVVIGGGEFGVDAGMYLAKSGHNVTMLTSEKELMRIDRVHYPEILMDTYEQMDNFDFILEATARNISEGKVTYMDAKGSEKSIQADSVVLYAGLKPRQDEALKFYGSAKISFYTIGDCTTNGGNVQKSVRSAFFAASQI